jgi:hypothetical protein
MLIYLDIAPKPARMQAVFYYHKTKSNRRIRLVDVLQEQKPIYEEKQVLMKKPVCAIRRGLFGSARQEEVRIKYDTDLNGNMLSYAMSYGFVRQMSEKWTEEDRNEIYNYLVDQDWSVTVSMTIKCHLSPREVITKGIAFKRAYFAAFDQEHSSVEELISVIDEEYKKFKAQYEEDYADVTDLEKMKKILLASDIDGEGFGFETITDTRSGTMG